ncbi:hypothetical protein HMPREF9141_0897 [Prevotella multiformis DSM 16608]|uniref:Uncharacterized protein n=1 Tax=Prevotella multiformis DSM 16608 TaxID=888743 RepID=F0F5N1_9BACT|nr:hypothetical protein HMPREF9141_0897 [Prevotella multiformis DSM 16608]
MQERKIDAMPVHRPVFPSSTDNPIPISPVSVNCFHATKAETGSSDF